MDRNYSARNKIKDIFSLIIKSFILSFVGFIVFIVVIMAIYYGDLYFNVKSGNYKSPLFNSYVIVSQSMVPTIKVNDAIIVKRDNYDRYIVGDIISFYSTEYDSNGMVVTHRIINKDKKNSTTSLDTTKGDNNSIADKNSVQTDNVYGKVLFVLPKIGFIKNFLSNPLNIILCILIPSTIVIVVDLGHISILFRKHTKIV